VTDLEPVAPAEPVEAFRARARAWLADNYPRVDDEPATRSPAEMTDEEEVAYIARSRELQRLLYDGGLAGVCFPTEYGGLGLTPEHQRVLNEEVVGYATPRLLQVPTFTPCAAVLLEFGTEEQKRRHLPAIIKGEEIWSQFLSEPSGGSDVAGALTTAVRDGDEWVINGSKIWTSGGYASDYGLTLVRTNWDVPKHRGLSVFIVKTYQPDVEVHRIEMINGSHEFCQEFFTDLRVPDSNRVGEVDQGWTVGTRWMFHEKDALGGASQYVTGSIFAGGAAEPDARLIALARETGRIDDPVALDLIGDAYTLDQARRALGQRLVTATRVGALPDSSAALARLMAAVVTSRIIDIRVDLAGPNAVATVPDDPWADDAFVYLERQATAIGGGTVEMARNNIAERVLGMPREMTHDKNMPYRDVPKGPPAK
jgi:alkylation response protein AidB-like acyl-CoA dehydrogenase